MGLRQTITLHECVQCGHITVAGSIHGCVKCLTKLAPAPFEVVRVEETVR